MTSPSDGVARGQRRDFVLGQDAGDGACWDVHGSGQATGPHLGRGGQPT